MPPHHGALVIFGCGPGIGVHVATQFASNGFPLIILSSRNASRLRDDVKAIHAAAPNTDIETVSIDVSDANSVRKGTKEIDEIVKAKGQVVEVVHYNAARVGESELLKYGVEDIEMDLKISVSGFYTVSQWAIPHLRTLAQSDKDLKPTLLITGGLLHVEPIVGVFSLSLAKTAQHNLAFSLFKEYGKEGVHVGMVCVGGVVSPEAKVTTPKNIAEKFWGLYRQEKGKWEKEVSLEEPGYWEWVRS